MKTSRLATGLAAALVWIGLTPGAATRQSGRPNILLIVTDDMGYADIGLHGSRDIPTPNIDALMKAGTSGHRQTPPSISRRLMRCSQTFSAIWSCGCRW